MTIIRNTYVSVRPDISVPFYYESDEALNDPETDNYIRNTIMSLWRRGLITMDSSLSEDLTELTLVVHVYDPDIVFQEGGNYQLGTAELLPAETEYNKKHGITKTVTYEFIEG